MEHKIVHVRTAITDKMTASFSESVRQAITVHRSNGQPVARYDAMKKKAYLQYPDGTTEYYE